jgi:hypothetical protein
MQNEKLIFNILLDQWDGKVKQLTTLFQQLGENSGTTEVYPGKNKVIYLLGHLTAASDAMLEALDISDRRHTQFDRIFFAPQMPGTVYPEYSVLLNNWIGVNAVLTDAMKEFSPEHWLTKHAYVNAEDFDLQPNRNKFNILVTRIAHLNNHYGQLVLVRRTPVTTA